MFSLNLAVGKPINHPPVITMFIGGMVTIPSRGWCKWHCFNHIRCAVRIPGVTTSAGAWAEKLWQVWHGLGKNGWKNHAMNIACLNVIYCDTYIYIYVCMLEKYDVYWGSIWYNEYTIIPVWAFGVAPRQSGSNFGGNIHENMWTTWALWGCSTSSFL